MVYDYEQSSLPNQHPYFAQYRSILLLSVAAMFAL